MNQEDIMAVLSNSEVDAKSLREIAQEIGLDTSSHAGWIKAERGLSGILRKLIKWGFVAYVRKKNENGHRYWYNLYWKNKITTNEWSAVEEIVAEQS
jgi:predicted transcriptional regulator